jgi:nucleoside-diphosphate-sugar epimerase
MTSEDSAHIAVVGGNGVFARHLIPRLVAAGHRVRALVRRPEAAGVARACGADVRVADIFDEASLRAGLSGCNIGINLATSLPGPSGRGDYEANDRLRRDGTATWVSACKEAGIGRVIQQSIAMVNAAPGDTWTDEDTVAPAMTDEVVARAIEAALSMERTVHDSALDALILRGGLFYGPGTGFDDDWFGRAKAGKLRLPGDGDTFVSLVHIADMVDATLTAIARWPREKTLIIADDRPVRWRELFAFVAESAGGPAPTPGGRIGFPSFRVRNARAREALGWKPFYGDFRAGLAR